MENKSTGKTVTIIILILIILGLGGYIAYDKLIIEKNAPQTEKTEEKNENIEENKLNDEDIKAYLEYIPFENDDNVLLCSWNPTKGYNCENEVKYLDAYSSSKATKEEISDELMLRMAIYKSEELDMSEFFESDFDLCGEDENGNKRSCMMGQYYSANDVINNIKKMYNRNVEPKDFSAGGCQVYYKNDAFAVGCSAGNNPPAKINKIDSYEIKDDELLIYEKALFIYELTTKTNNFIDITLQTAYKEDNIIKSFNVENYDANNISTEAKEFAEDNLDSANKYKHTFKKNNNGEYYWYSTEIVK